MSIQEARTKQQQLPKENFKKKIYSYFMNASNDKKESNEASEEPEKQYERKIVLHSGYARRNLD